MNEQKIADKQTFLQVDISLTIYATPTISVFGLLNLAIVWGDP